MEPATVVTPAAPCPLESQRSMPGLILKLFVVNFVTLCFYFHCYHQREGRYLTLDAIVFFLAPLNTVVRYGVALLSIIGYACYGIASSYHDKNSNRQSRRRETLTKCSRALSALLGRKRIPGNRLQLDDIPRHPRTERIASRIGPVIPVLGFIVQCCGAIYLYNRRRQQKGLGVTMIDQQIFQLACGGLALGIISAGYTLRLPYFDTPVPDSRKTPLEHLIHVLRDQNDDDDGWLRAESSGVQGTLYALKSLAIAFLIQLLILRNSVFLNIYREVVGPIWWLWVLVLGVACGLFTLSSSTTPPPPPGLAAWEKAARSATVFCSCFLCLAIMLVLVTGTVGAVGWHLSFYVLLGLQADELNNGLVDEGQCPLLMADPEAEYIWWLG
ncbi:hypothetical protein BJX64DRAFT_250915 [Aspergillus heterothallicus]